MSEEKKNTDGATEADAHAADAFAEAAFAANIEDSADHSEASAAELSPEAEDDAAAALIAELEAERDDLKKKLMYAFADVENLRKRAERERREAEAFGGTRLARDLLSVHDNLGRALGTVDDALREAGASFVEGVELTQRELLSAFAKHKIEKVSPAVGDKFDPNFHQAMFEAPIPGAEPGSVIEVMQDGFTIAGRLLRPALVGVAREAPDAANDG